VSEWRRKAGVAKRRLINAGRELRPPKPADAEQRFARKTGPKKYAVEAGSATERLHARLSESALAAIAERASESDELTELPVPPGAPPQTVRYVQGWEDSTGIERKRWDLTLGVHFELPEVLEATGLTTAMPPGEIHAMTHSPLAAGGGFYQADLVADALASVGAPLSAGDRGLDYGCSSGRVVRVLAAACPEAEWHGCDPNGPAIAWAQQQLKMAQFAESGNNPPLPYPEDHFAVAFAISIWSHHAEQAALRWYDEMWRILRPGGHLISTTHGNEAIAFYNRLGLRANQQLAEVQQALYESGYWYAAEFGETGDWGVVNPEWGTSFVSAEWMLDNLTPKWQLAEYATGRNEDNQDVYVLRKPS
jgi:SAM-dependent methyltransferase